MESLEKQIKKYERIMQANNIMSFMFKAATHPRETITKLIGRDKNRMSVNSLHSGPNAPTIGLYGIDGVYNYGTKQSYAAQK
jgi:hypothetical protein